MTTPSENQFAVVTGASSGIGYELARKLAERGYDLLIIAEDDGIELAAANLRRDGTTQVTAVRADLADYDGVETAWTAIQAAGRDVDALALNAGRGIGGEFVGGTDLSDELNVIDLNVTSTVHLAKRVLPAMVARKAGRVLFTSSIASMMPGTYQAVYNAGSLKTKAQAVASKVMPDRAKAEMHRRMAEPGSATE
jgi:uncharacterized protein